VGGLGRSGHVEHEITEDWSFTAAPSLSCHRVDVSYGAVSSRSVASTDPLWHLQSVVDKAGRLDISFDAVGIPNAGILGVPLVELDVEQFSSPITTLATSYFLTAHLAARRMIPNKSGVIMTVTAAHSREGIPLVGGYGPAQAAKEALTRELSAELAPQGIRVVGLRPYAMPETPTIKDAFEPRAKASGMTWEQWQEMLASRTHSRRLMTLEEMANTAVFVASDKASGMTGTTVNLTMGRLDD
jgi:NAD(P)-dependent dehydrogenase (short-subunit alcohol dehydrogenase family)